MRIASSVFVVVNLVALAGCPRTTLIGAPCDDENGQDPCEGRAQLFCVNDYYQLQEECSAKCPKDGVIEPLIPHEQETISGDTTWACLDGAHVVTGVVNVAAGATLTIEAGTSVRVDPSSRIDVDPAGRVVADARPFAPIIMTSNNGQAAGFGSSTSGGLNVFATTEGEPSVLRNFIVERGIHGLGVFALSSTAQTPIIQNCTFRDNEQFGIKVTCDEVGFEVPDFTVKCDGGDAPCENSFFTNKAGDISPCE